MWIHGVGTRTNVYCVRYSGLCEENEAMKPCDQHGMLTVDPKVMRIHQP